jgi:hypothetical protein
VHRVTLSHSVITSEKQRYVLQFTESFSVIATSYRRRNDTYSSLQSPISDGVNVSENCGMSRWDKDVPYHSLNVVLVTNTCCALGLEPDLGTCGRGESGREETKIKYGKCGVTA